MQQQNSQMFNADHSQEIQVKEKHHQPHFFNKNTEIIKEGQRHKVIFGQMEQQKKPLHQIVAPYLYKFASTTAQIATQAGTTTLNAVKTGLIWVYNKFVNNVIPYAVQNLPKVLFVIKKGVQPANINSGTFQVIDVQDKEYQSIYHTQQKKNGKTRVVIPMGTQNDKSFKEYLEKQKYQISYQFPIDQNTQENYQVKEAFMMPAQSFQTIVQAVSQSHAQLQMPNQINKKAYQLQNCFIFELQGKNTIQYDMLDNIQKCKDAHSGYIVFPQQTLRKSVREESGEMDPIAQMAQGKQKMVQFQPQKQVDMERNVHVQITKRKSKGQAEMILN